MSGKVCPLWAPKSYALVVRVLAKEVHRAFTCTGYSGVAWSRIKRLPTLYYQGLNVEFGHGFARGVPTGLTLHEHMVVDRVLFYATSNCDLLRYHVSATYVGFNGACTSLPGRSVLSPIDCCY